MGISKIVPLHLAVISMENKKYGLNHLLVEAPISLVTLVK